MFRIVTATQHHALVLCAYGVPQMKVPASVLIVLALMAKAVAACIFGHDRNWRNWRH